MTSEEPHPSKILRMSNKQLLLFVELYKQHECLWNSNLEDYPHKYKRRRAAADIADKLGIEGFTAHHVLVKFKNLRSSYGQERKRIAESEARVAKGKAKQVYEPTLCWFATMDSFIRPHVRQKTTVQHTKARPKVPQRKKKTSEKEDNAGKMECDVQTHVDLTVNKKTRRITLESSDNEASNDSHPKRKDSIKIESRDQEIDELMKQHQQDVKEELDDQDNQVQSTNTDYLLENECDFRQCFGNYVSSLLSKMPTQKALELQPKILKLIFSNFEEN